MQYDVSVSISGYIRVSAEDEDEAYGEAGMAMVELQDSGTIKDFDYNLCECIPVVRED